MGRKDDLLWDMPWRKEKRKKPCQYPGCAIKLKLHTHHLTYHPEVKTKLCRTHHEDITIINANKAFSLKRKLTNRERIELWIDWIEGKVVPNRTPEALEWIKKW